MSETLIHGNPKPLTIRNLLLVIGGSALYAGSLNLFLQPLRLYAGGIPGLSQVLRTLFFSDFSGLDAAGLINFVFNVPLFVLAWKAMHHKMLVCTLLSVLIQTVVFTLVPVPAQPILDDKLACIAGSGIAGGHGCGIVLSNGGSGGGLDLLGVYLTSKFQNFSVGKLSILFNACLYVLCACMFDLSTALYSAMFIVFFSITIDRFHYQNIEVELMIFTHYPECADVIMKKYVRGVTAWAGEGAYTKADTHVLVTVVSRNEVDAVRRDILASDPKAFIIAHEAVHVTGGYQKRLDE
jgi:uncharacterized membrane-anchored protein YitT (DUF2179 family)